MRVVLGNRYAEHGTFRRLRSIVEPLSWKNSVDSPSGTLGEPYEQSHPGGRDT